jgi:hypothetical protein
VHFRVAESTDEVTKDVPDRQSSSLVEGDPQTHPESLSGTMIQELYLIQSKIRAEVHGDVFGVHDFLFPFDTGLECKRYQLREVPKNIKTRRTRNLKTLASKDGFVCSFH